MSLRPLLASAVVLVLLGAAPAGAISPQNPYRSFNLSGINYGSMQWERAQREGRRVWPYFNAPTRTGRGGTAVMVGGYGSGGGVVRSATPSSRRVFRRWRR